LLTNAVGTVQLNRLTQVSVGLDLTFKWLTVDAFANVPFFASVFNAMGEGFWAGVLALSEIFGRAKLICLG